MDVTGISREELNAQNASIDNIKQVVKNCDYIINCIGIIKPYIHDDNRAFPKNPENGQTRSKPRIEKTRETL
jgi:hypothetical protein